MPKTTTITILTDSLKMERDPIVNNIPEYIAGIDIRHVSGTFNQKPLTATEGEWPYRYDTMTVLQIELTSGRYFTIELQEVSNQATWNLGTMAALQQAINDISALIE